MGCSTFKGDQDIKKEEHIKGYADSLPFKTISLIAEQMKNNVCKIEKENSTGTGFLCTVPFYDKFHLLPVLITCYHVLGKNDVISGKKIKLVFNNNIKYLLIDNSRLIYFSEDNEYDTTIIEIRQEDGFNLDNLFEIDNNIFKTDELNDLYKEQTIYIIHYPKGLDANYSMDVIKRIDISNSKIYHLCTTYGGSSGSPILNLQNYKVIGIHSGKHNKYEYNVGTLIKGPLNEFKKLSKKEKMLEQCEHQIEKKNLIENKKIKKIKENEIYMVLEILEEDINKPAYFLYKNNDNNEDEDENDNLLNPELIDITKLDIIIFINDKEMKEKNKFFIPENKGFYKIKIVFKYQIINCKSMFAHCTKIIEIDLSEFDTQNAINMSFMFCGCTNLKNINLSDFDTQNVTNMSYMFANCGITSLNLSSFDTKNVNDMSGMFALSTELTNLNISSFDTRNVTTMNNMFRETDITELDLSFFDTKNVKDMACMFAGISRLKYLNISSFDTSNVTDMKWMFRGNNYSKLDLTNFNTENVTNMSYMFSESGVIDEMNISSFNTKNVTNMFGMFSKTKIKNLDLSNFDTRNVTDMEEMFYDCEELTNLNLSSFDTKKVIKMKGMFYGCINLMSLNLPSTFNTQNVIDMSNMFFKCSKLESLDLSFFNTQNVENMDLMFSGCHNLSNINLLSFDTRKVEYMRFMFNECYNLKILDLSSFIIQNNISIAGIFCHCKNLYQINLKNFNIRNANIKCSSYEYEDLFNIEYSKFNNEVKYLKFLDDKEENTIFYFCDNLKQVIINKKYLDDFKKITSNDIFVY